jgi:hypothetical protein
MLMLPENTFLQKALVAIQSQDFQAIEYLRDDITQEDVYGLVSQWSSVLPWPIKDGYIALLMDQSGEVVKPLMQDALNSPSVESRAYALCSLTGNFGIFNSLLGPGSMLDDAKVDAAIKQYRN